MAWSALPTAAFGANYFRDTASGGSIPNATADVEYVCIPIASLPGVSVGSSGEADDVNGDSRIITRGIMDMLYGWYNGLATADRPGKLTISRSGLVGTGDTVERTWTVKLTLDATLLEVDDE